MEKMLKLIDDVKFEELEKYGFEINEEKKILSDRYVYALISNQILAIDVQTRKIFVENIDGSLETGAVVDVVLPVLFHLVQDNLIEEVE